MDILKHTYSKQNKRTSITSLTVRERTYLFNATAHSSNYRLVCHQSSCSKVTILLCSCSCCKRFVNASISKAKICCLIKLKYFSSLFPFFLSFFFVLSLGRKRTGLAGYNINKTNQNANRVQNWFGLVFLAEPCFNSFDRTSSLALRYSIVLSLYKCNTTRTVERNRTTRA